MLKKFFAVNLVILILLSQFTSSAVSGAEEYACTFNTTTSQILARMNQPSYSDWISRLSGEIPVQIDHAPHSIATRYTYAMFPTQQANARAFDYITQRALSYLPAAQVQVQSFPFSSFTAKNLIIDLHGIEAPEEIVILSAHLDSRSESSYLSAPGADDNATGAAALLEATRLLRNYRFKRTIRLIWFTGEEQGLVGSKAYTNAPSFDPAKIVGVINLDMFGYDGDGDSCFELHVGTLPASDNVGQCLASSIDGYQLGLTYDYITTGATTASDHASFWLKNVGAVEILENAFTNTLPGGCVGRDINPNYHLTSDTLANMHPGYAFSIAKAGIAAAAGLAGTVDACLGGSAPRLKDATVTTGAIELEWDAVTDAAGYRVFRSTQACGGEITRVADVSATRWVDRYIVDGQVYHYWVEATGSSGCFSVSDGCASLEANAYTTFAPIILK